MQVLEDLREFVGRQSHNYRMMLVRSGSAMLLFNLTSNYNSIYTEALGADPVTLGSMSSLSSGINTAISLPSGWLSDIYSLKKIMGLGMAIQVLMVGLYAFARDWTWILIAMALQPFTMALLMRSQSVMMSNGLNDEDRATGFGLRMTLAQILGLLSPIPAALLVDHFGGLNVEGIRPLYYLRFAGLAIAYAYIFSRLTDVPPRPRSDEGSIIEDFKVVLRQGEGLKAWIGVGVLGGLVWGTINPFIFLYAKNVKGADALTLGLMTTISTVISIILAIPVNRLADTRGRKFTILVTRPALWIWFVILILAPHPNWLIVGWLFRGIGMSSSAYNTLAMELVPKEHRGRWLGITNAFSSLVRIPAPLLGGFLYEDINPSLVFVVSLLADMLIRMPLLALKVPETRERVEVAG
ncbi:MAG: MFS transporter [Candidatus Bathyarchaeia archaeon]